MKSSLIPFVYLAGLLAVVSAPRNWSEEVSSGAPTRIGEAGAPALLSIAGVQTFAGGEIQRALRSDFEYLVASSPEATPAECLAVLEERIREGYRYGGFPGALVQARYDSSARRIVVKVAEGQRFRCGAVEVTGLTAIPIVTFKRRFAEELVPSLGESTPGPELWKPGSPASFTADQLAGYSIVASNTFADLGRFAARFKVEIRPQATGSDAALVVTVADEGPASFLSEVEVVGNKKNRAETVTGFLGLSKGMALTQDLIDEKERALARSARFATSSIVPIDAGHDGKVSLRIALLETSRFPPLEQPLSREERALLRLRDWLMDWKSRQEDLVLSWTQPKGMGLRPRQIEMIVAASGGILARVVGNSPELERLQDFYSIIVKSEELAFFAQVHQRKLRIRLPGYSGQLLATLGPSPDLADGFGLTFGVGLGPGHTNNEWRVRLEVSASALTDFLHRPGTKATWEAGVLAMQTEELMLRVEESSGRLLELSSVDQPSASNTDETDPYRMAVGFKSGAFNEAADRIVESTSAHADVYQSQRALGSALGFIIDELFISKELWAIPATGTPPPLPAALPPAVEKLLTSSFLDPLQRLLDDDKSQFGAEIFTIPPRPVRKRSSEQQLIASVLLWCAGHAHELAPADSWLETLFREPALMFAARAEHSPDAIARLAASEDLGPIGCFAVLHALLWSHQDGWALFPAPGLNRLSLRDLRRECQMLFSPGSAMTQSFANLIRALGLLTPAEVAAVASVFSSDGTGLAPDIAAASKIARHLPVTDIVGPALDWWWESMAKQAMAEDFRIHARQAAEK